MQQTFGAPLAFFAAGAFSADAAVFSRFRFAEVFFFSAWKQDSEASVAKEAALAMRKGAIGLIIIAAAAAAAAAALHPQPELLFDDQTTMMKKLSTGHNQEGVTNLGGQVLRAIGGWRLQPRCDALHLRILRRIETRTQPVCTSQGCAKPRCRLKLRGCSTWRSNWLAGGPFPLSWLAPNACP